MTEWLPIILQTFVILLGIVGSAVYREHRITAIETKVEHLESAVRPIPGISRAVARLEGRSDH